MAMRLKDLHQDPAYLRWSLRAIIWRETGEMVGHIGFHTPPDPSYLTLERAGSKLVADLSQLAATRGGARNLQRLLPVRSGAGSTAIHSVDRPDNQASTALARSLGFVELGQQVDGEEGPELLYRLECNKSGNADTGSPKSLR